MDITLPNQINGIPSGFPATDLVRELLKSLMGYGGQGRDVQLLGQVFHRSLVVYNAIQDCMRVLQNSASLDWVTFDRYTEAIPPLEK